MRWHLSVLGSFALVSCASESPPPDVAWASIAEEEIVLERVHSAYRPTLTDTVGLSRPRAMAVSGDTIVVVDRDVQIAVFDREYDLRARWSQSGEGPGELRNPVDVIKTTAGWLVADIGNGRLESFGPTGDPLHSIRVEGVVTQVAEVSDGVLVLGGGATYVSLVSPDGERDWGPRRPARDTTGVEGRAVALDRDELSQIDGGVVILDGLTGEIIVVREDEEVVARWALPQAVRDEMFAETGVVTLPDVDGFGILPAFLGMAAERTGQWAAIMPGGMNPYEAPLFVNLSTGVWHPSRIAFPRELWPAPHNARDIVLEDGWVHIVTPSEATVLSIPVDLSNRE